MKDDFSFIGVVVVLISDVVGHNPALDLHMPLVNEIKFHSHQRVHVGWLRENTTQLYLDVMFTDGLR